MAARFVNFFTSLRLTVACLCLAIVLIFVGTLEQVRMGLYAVQSEFFRSFFIYWTPQGTHWKIPIFPGGWCLGLVLLANLLAAHIKRFKFTPKKYGIILIHGGLILLLVGQFVTEIFQVESQMWIDIGATKNYSEAPRKDELAIIDVTDPDKDRVVAIPESLVAKGGEIRTPSLPFTLRVENYLPNSAPVGPMMTATEKIQSSDGIGRTLSFTPVAITRTMDDVNKPSARVQVVSDKGPIGDWLVSTWLTRHPLFERLPPGTAAPQTFTYNGRTYQIALRPVRYYKPYSITLLAFHDDLYPGTDIAKNYSSKIHLVDRAHGEDRDILIYMNNPLRYRGETFYQAGVELDDRGTVLQVVRNPASLAPYLACGLVALGLVVQFLMHLFSFARKRSAKAKPVPARSNKGGSLPEPALASAKRSRL